MKKAAKNNDQAFDFKTIKSFEDACKKVNVNPADLPELSMIPDEFRNAILSVYKLFIIFKAINDGWTPDWSNRRQDKYFSWFWVLSSGFGFVGSA